jgi:hypothetical protein
MESFGRFITLDIIYEADGLLHGFCFVIGHLVKILGIHLKETKHIPINTISALQPCVNVSVRQFEI